MYECARNTSTCVGSQSLRAGKTDGVLSARTKLRNSSRCRKIGRRRWWRSGGGGGGGRGASEASRSRLNSNPKVDALTEPGRRNCPAIAVGPHIEAGLPDDSQERTPRCAQGPTRCAATSRATGRGLLCWKAPRSCSQSVRGRWPRLRPVEGHYSTSTTATTAKGHW